MALPGCARGWRAPRHRWPRAVRSLPVVRRRWSPSFLDERVQPRRGLATMTLLLGVPTVAIDDGLGRCGLDLRELPLGDRPHVREVGTARAVELLDLALQALD